MSDIQPSRLLPALFENLDDSLPLTVLDLGPAQPETLEFFSTYRCKLHFCDLYQDLPLKAGEDGEPSLDARLEEVLALPGGALFDICFFWDLPHFLSRDAVSRLMGKLRPHLHPDSRGHCFAPHNTKTPAAAVCHGIADVRHFSVRKRRAMPPGYQPHPQGELGALLRYLQVERSVLLPDRRIELLLKVTR
ncbi:MAG: hypothetical protein ACK5HY_01975 [Parahaliea sp.]